jgi:hypothetical protein
MVVPGISKVEIVFPLVDILPVADIADFVPMVSWNCLEPATKAIADVRWAGKTIIVR